MIKKYCSFFINTKFLLDYFAEREKEWLLGYREMCLQASVFFSLRCWLCSACAVWFVASHALCSYFRKRDNYPEIGPDRAVWSLDNVCLIPDAARCANSLRIRDGKSASAVKKYHLPHGRLRTMTGNCWNSQMTRCSKCNEESTYIAFLHLKKCIDLDTDQLIRFPGHLWTFSFAEKFFKF